MEKETEYARSITKLTDHDHEALIRYYKSLKPEERTSVHDLQTEISRKNFRSDRPRTGGYYYATFLLAIKEYVRAQSRSILTMGMTPKAAARIDRLRATAKAAQKAREPSNATIIVKKRRKMIARWREEGKSWFAIKGLLHEKYGEAISHTSLITHFNK